MVASLGVGSEQIAQLCRRHRIHRLSVFGSALRPDFQDKSDIDLLVEFEPGYSPGWDIIEVEEDFSRLFGNRPVDLVNPRYLNHRLKERVLRSAVIQYEAGDGSG